MCYHFDGYRDLQESTQFANQGGEPFSTKKSCSLKVSSSPIGFAQNDSIIRVGHSEME